MSNVSNAADMVARCATRQDVDAPSLASVEEALALQPRANPEEEAWIASRTATQERLTEPDLPAMEVVAPTAS